MPLRDLCHQTFIQPFLYSKRNLLFFAAILGAFGFMSFHLYISVDLVQFGFWVVLTFFCIRPLIANFLYLPGLLILFQRFPFKSTLIAILSFQCIIFSCFLLYPQLFLGEITAVKATWLSIYAVLVTAPFWMGYYIVMNRITSDSNRGNEVSIAELCIQAGVVSGSVAGGAAYSYFPSIIFVSFSISCVVLATAILMCLSLSLPMSDGERDNATRVFDKLLEDRARFQNTILSGGQTFLFTIYFPVWLSLVGLTALGAGIFIAAQFVLKLIVSPIAGHLTNKGGVIETIIGAVIKSMGWLPWLFAVSPLTLVWSSLAWSVGDHMYNVGIVSRWYEGRTPAHMAAREICLGIGRLMAALILIPASFLNMQLFFLLALMISGCVIMVSIIERRNRLQTAAPVVKG